MFIDIDCKLISFRLQYHLCATIGFDRTHSIYEGKPEKLSNKVEILLCNLNSFKKKIKKKTFEKLGKEFYFEVSISATNFFQGTS